MEIKIKSLTLQNFKGVKNAEIQFDGHNMLIEGENGTGKSTIFDAFTWLLFGKDHAGQDQTQFDIKTIDPRTKRPIARLDHSVSAVLLVDGCEKSLQRIWRENWVKPKGESEAVFKGHVSVFLVDGVDVGTKTAYDSVIHQWIDEDVFKMITNPLYFIDDEYTPWKVRRETLLGLVDGEVDRSAILSQFSDLLAEMKGDTMDMFKKRIASLKKENKALLAECDPKIKAYKEAMPAPVDEAALKKEKDALSAQYEELLVQLNKELEKVDEGIADVNRANEERTRAIDQKYARVAELQLEMGNVMTEGLKDAQSRAVARNQAILEAQAKVREAAAEKNDMAMQVSRASQALDDARIFRAELAANLKEDGVKYSEAKGRTFNYQPTTRCHACGQELPAETVEQAVALARKNFIDSQKAELNRIMEDAQKLKEDIAGADAEISLREEKLKALQGSLDEAEKNLKAAEAVLEEKSAVPQVDIKAAEAEVKKSAEYLGIASEIRSLQSAALELSAKSVSAAQLILSRRSVEAKISQCKDEFKAKMKPFDDALALIPERERIGKLIEAEEKREKVLAEEVARLERLEYSAAEYVKADIDAQEGAINSLFAVARWKMFDATLDGNIVETCEVTTQSGVPFRSMNDAMKIQCGMDVIRVLGEKYGAYAPIFIDNAESITRSKFDTTAQVIRLCVKAGETSLHLKSE